MSHLGRHRPILSNWKGMNKSREINVKIPLMVKTLLCDGKDQFNPLVPAFREELPVIHWVPSVDFKCVKG